MIRLFNIAAFVAVLGFAPLRARAGIIEAGPFVGDLTETWESFPTTFEGVGPYPSDPSFIMGGAATISNPYMFIYEPGVSEVGLGSSGDAQTSDGVRGMGLPSPNLFETVTIIFEQPILAFGAFWGAATDDSPNVGDPAWIVLRFYDPTDDLIDTRTFSYSRSAQEDGLLEWHGWTSDLEIGSLTYTETGVAIDGLQAIVPEPSALYLFLLIAIAVFNTRQPTNHRMAKN